MLNIKVVTWSLALWTSFSFVFCVAFAMLTPSSLVMHAAAAAPARIRVVQLAWLSRGVDRELPLWRICGSGLCAHLQLSASQVGTTST